MLPVRALLQDGSCLSEIVAARDKNRRQDPAAVRVIEYTLTLGGPVCRLITTILDPKAASAASLAALYAQRWETGKTNFGSGAGCTARPADGAVCAVPPTPVVTPATAASSAAGKPTDRTVPDAMATASGSATGKGACRGP
ncbi:hypothetical protein [Streptomyces sp. NPDC002540]